MEPKTCFTCKATKPLAEFPKNGKHADGSQLWSPYCMPCNSEKQRRRREPKLKTRPIVNPRGVDSLPTKTCTGCATVFPTDTFYSAGFRDGKLRRVSKCPECQSAVDTAFYHANLDSKRDRSYRRRNGITLAKYDALLESQNFRCAICGIHENEVKKRFSVDHDHACCPGEVRGCDKCVRGLLCGPCNRGIGQFYDEPKVLLAAHDYVASKSRPLLRLEVR